MRQQLLPAVCLCWGLIGALGIAQAQQPAWPFENQIGQFTVHADFDIVSRKEFVSQLGSLQRDVAETLQIEIHPEAIHLILFDQQATYQAYMSRYFPKVPFRRALFIKRRGPGMVFAFQSPEMYVDVRHETTHALLNASLPYVPLWLDEGLAEYFESLPDDPSRPHAHWPAIRLRALWGRVPSVEKLEAIDDLSDMGTKQYEESWSWVHFLLHESPQSKAILIRFLQDLQAHSPPGQLSRRIAAEMPDWKRRYIKHFRR